MVRLGVGSAGLCLIACVTASIQPRWAFGDTATGDTGSDVIEGCEYWVNDIGTGDNCEAIEDYFDITEKQFLSWNPSVPLSCTLVRGWSYCVAGPENPIISSSTTATATPAGTLTYSGTAAPTQSGISSACTHYYLVQSDDTCYTIQDQFMSFTLQEFYSWNPSISSGCHGLQPGYFVCVGDGSAPVTTTAISSSPASTSSGTPSTTGHQPHQTGITSDCTQWYFVVDGDTCDRIAQKYDITKEQFYTWNPATGSTCTNLWLDNYVCVGISSSSVSTTTPTTSAPSSTSSGAPGPTGSGTVADCEIYYKAQSGDSCWSIVNEKYTYLTQALLTKWNPSLGAECTLIKDQYYCVAIKTAQPMPGTVDTCTRWHLAADGDGCWSIEQEYGISATQFNGWNPRVGSDCANLWLGYYVCVGL